ncbi:MAG: hypothetical protein DHS20C16_27110 [Phycisphaerae bacterium]|nr:MAG: hypothetical protein DHS20C16_27110 [Phycisphaerae bacterium]
MASSVINCKSEGGDVSPTQTPDTKIDQSKSDDVFNLTIEEVRMVVRYRTLSSHQQRGVLQAMDVIRPAKPKKAWAARPPIRPADFGAGSPTRGKFWR